MTNLKATIYRQLEDHVPSNAVHYCLDLWIEKPFVFRISRVRQTKLGDYRYDRSSGEHVITVNHNLNPYSFLITYIHEVAHLVVSEQTGKYNKPHGPEWKQEFRRLLQPVMNDLVFPIDVLQPLIKHMANPKATTHSDPRLLRALRQFDDHNGEVYLSDISPGNSFTFKGRRFRKEGVRRTRAVCVEISTGRKFLISEIAPVKPLG